MSPGTDGSVILSPVTADLKISWVFSFPQNTYMWINGFLGVGLEELLLYIFTMMLQNSYSREATFSYGQCALSLKTDSIPKTGKGTLTFYWTAALRPSNPIYLSIYLSFYHLSSISFYFLYGLISLSAYSWMWNSITYLHSPSILPVIALLAPTLLLLVKSRHLTSVILGFSHPHCYQEAQLSSNISYPTSREWSPLSFSTNTGAFSSHKFLPLW